MIGPKVVAPPAVPLLPFELSAIAAVPPAPPVPHVYATGELTTEALTVA